MLLPQVFPVSCHTDYVGKGTTFVAIKGLTTDGNNFIEEAISKGASRIICQSESENYMKATQEELENTIPKEKIYIKNGVEFIYVKDSRKALAVLSAKALNFPAKKLKIIGVTGTKGKTTTTFMIEHILSSAGFKTAIFGSIKNKILNKEEKSMRATMGADYIQMALSECIQQNVDFVVLEVSSHALSLERTYGIEFDIVCFTNFSSDHMDFYNSLDEYFQAKCKILNQVKTNGSIILNIDNNYVQKATKLIDKNKNDYVLISKDLQQESLGYKIQISNNKYYGFTKEAINIENLKINNSKIFGEFNNYNLSMAATACSKLGISNQIISQSLSSFTGAPGRLQLHILKNGAKAFVDYAHNALSIQSVLETLRPLTSNLIVIFGCGGERDKTRRPAMGKISAEYADKIIITSDNPRSENPIDIATDIILGIQKEHQQKVVSELDRKKAIELGANISTKESIIAILGKGHEDYFLINDQKLHFNDFEEISRF